ncbi:hypothetical protein KC363_g898 [Hortaea werneckii]|nr:hypothetical protein KC325_g1334 [Hortaea werneckii]KAI6997371.1 hypothetical protein KC359_g3003 [Hortaea werneckii]KAI7148217.1 hypothetical protein KC344_g2154 [Hortaea werneckii]KAI7178059.1 hypothetical protein KC360_g1854 [Hortaea werneckii]KAI7196368.1 hypothetical protein KC363_g898 [Hortaea werneckii]
MDASPIAKLPAELRNNIYHEVLLHEKTIKLTFQPAEKNAKSRVLLSGSRQQHQMLALTLTCKPLRRETYDLFFALNSFEISVPETPAESSTSSIAIHRFLDGVTTFSARSAIKSITLDFSQHQVPKLYGALRDLQRNILPPYPRLPLKFRTSVASEFVDEESLDIELDIQNLVSSIGKGLEKIKGSRKATHSGLELELLLLKFGALTDKRRAGLQ